MTRWSERSDTPRGVEYDKRWAQRSAQGESIHGEADFICALKPASVLDAGCGTGRIARELARRGLAIVGVDLDPRMLDVARAKAPELEWHLRDVADLTLLDAAGQPRTFDIVVLAGNVMIFVEAGSEPAVVASAARHLDEGGSLVAGFQLGVSAISGARRLSLDDYDRYAERSGLKLVERWATWDRAPYKGGDYAVSVHRGLGD